MSLSFTHHRRTRNAKLSPFLFQGKQNKIELANFVAIISDIDQTNDDSEGENLDHHLS